MLSLDTHAHVVPEIAAQQLLELNACVVAVTRSPEEFESVANRSDATTIWALGCHPGLAKVQKSFDRDRFIDLLGGAAIVGEVGLDGSSRVPMDIQREVLSGVLEAASQLGRIVTAHNYRATSEILDVIEPFGGSNIILHWWLGTSAETKRAIELGCSFSINASSVNREEIVSAIPLDRVLTETDHPFGDRRSSQPRRPGAMEVVERKLADRYQLSPSELRLSVWRNFGHLVTQTNSEDWFPARVRWHLEQAAS